jgi:magnesium transporter
MMHVYAARDGALERLDGDAAGLPRDGVWIDLNHPTSEEERLLKAWLGLALPTREEMQEIEASSRLYDEDGALYMTAVVVSRAETREPANTPVTFIVTQRHLVTVRYADPLAFRNFVARCTRQPKTVASSDIAFIGLLEAIVDRVADILERVANDLDELSLDVFAQNGAEGSARRRPTSGRSAYLEQVITRPGQNNDLATKLLDSLLSIGRLVPFFRENADSWVQSGVRTRMKILDRDLRSLNEHQAYLTSKVNFLLNATLGLINIQQNAIIKIFSVVAVVFMPPTLVASIYGMNFKHIPELDLHYGYPMALLIMAASALLPFLYFKWRKWL